jgi:hypothetical protein
MDALWQGAPGVPDVSVVPLPTHTRQGWREVAALLQLPPDAARPLFPEGKTGSCRLTRANLKLQSGQLLGGYDIIYVVQPTCFQVGLEQTT